MAWFLLESVQWKCMYIDRLQSVEHLNLYYLNVNIKLSFIHVDHVYQTNILMILVRFSLEFYFSIYFVL